MTSFCHGRDQGCTARLASLTAHDSSLAPPISLTNPSAYRICRENIGVFDFSTPDFCASECNKNRDCQAFVMAPPTNTPGNMTCKLYEGNPGSSKSEYDTKQGKREGNGRNKVHESRNIRKATSFAVSNILFNLIQLFSLSNSLELRRRARRQY